jgi:hypothetical protein
MAGRAAVQPQTINMQSVAQDSLSNPAAFQPVARKTYALSMQMAR